MIRGGIRPLAALVAAVLAAAALAACGDSGSGTTASVNSTGTTTTPPASKQSGAEAGTNGSGDSGSKPKGDGSGGSSPEVETAPLKISGGGSSQYRVKGGDNSIQDFGEESDESELEEAATSLHDFYVARAEEDWPAACSHLAKATVQQLEQLASRSGELAGAGCAKVLSALTPPLSPKVQKELTAVDAGSLRTEGEQAFLIYRGAEGTTYAISMTQESGGWKVGALAATPLS